MRALYFRELKELSLIGVPLLAAMGIAAADLVGTSDHTEGIVGLVLVCGAAVGVAQALIDRRLRDDTFLRHRPVSALALHSARTLAGLTVCLAGAAGFVLFFALFTELERERAELIAKIMAARDSRFAGMPREMFTLGPTHYLLIVGGLLAAWGSLRLAVSVRNLAAVLALLFLLPGAAWFVTARLMSMPAAGFCFLSLAALFGTTSVYCLSGDTR